MHVRPPNGAIITQPRPLTLDEVPGAVVVYHREWMAAPGRLLVACATRPIPIWLDGLESAALGGLNGMMRRHLQLTAIRPHKPSHLSTHLLQTFSGERDGTVVEGRHLLGFADSGTLLACSVVCEAKTSASCDALLGELAVEPAFVARQSTTVEKTLTTGLNHPRETVAGGLLIVLLAGALLLWRRPSEAALRRED